MTDYQHKIQELSFDEMIGAIHTDAASNDMISCRYAVRFVMLDSFDTFRSLREELYNKMGVRLLQFDTLLEDDQDSWITPDQIRHEMQKCTSATLVTPFSELVRFYDEQMFCGFMHDISLMEDTAHPHKRIYAPLIGMENRMMEFLKGFSRIKESAPIWSCHTERQETRVYLMEQTKLPPSSHITVLHTAYEWLQYWKSHAPQEVVICTSLPIRAYHRFSQPDNCFSFAEIANTYQLMTRMLGYHFPFPYNEKEVEQWEQMMAEVVKIPAMSFNYADYVRQRFRVMDIDAEWLLRLWTEPENNDFDRWLLRQYALVDDKLSSAAYLRQCLDAADLSASGLLVAIATRVPFVYVGKRIEPSLLSERAVLMKSAGGGMRQAVPPTLQEKLRQCIIDLSKQGDVVTAKALCTGTFAFEKMLAAGWFDLHEKDSFTKKDLTSLYPDMAAYLGTENAETPTGCEWMHNYFSQYRRAKLADKYPDGIASQMKERNGSSTVFYQWYHATPRCHDLLNKTVADYVYWVDGLGAEYIPYLQYLLAEHEHYAIGQCCYARADIPSSTQHNRYNLPEGHIFRQLDERAHDSHGYHKYNTLIEELRLLRSNIETIVNNHRHEVCRIAIVSDHGTSSLSRMVDSLRHNKTAEHEGRFLRCDSKPVDDTDFVYHTNETVGLQYKVALRHASLGIKPTHEVHGGCTPEEVLVPFILLVPSSEVVDYTVSLRENRIPITKPTIGVYIEPTPPEAILSISGKKYTLQYRNGTLWEAHLDNPSEGTHIATIHPLGGTPQNVEIDVFGMGFSNNQFDLFKL